MQILADYTIHTLHVFALNILLQLTEV